MPDADADMVAKRLMTAFLHLSESRQGEIRVEMQRAGLRGGLKTGIAKLVGIRSPSMLSDMLAGRLRGDRHRTALAAVLGVTRSWLEGDDSEAPDFLRSPGEVYQRYCRRIRRAWGDQGGGSEVEPDPEDDDSASTRLWMSWLRDDEARFHAELKQREIVAAALGFPPDSPEADWLAAGRFERVAFDLVLRFAAWLKLPGLTHPEIARAGHRAVQVALAHQQWLRQAMEDRLARYSLSESMFSELCNTLREHRKSLRKASDALMLTDFDDTWELLWRQQLRRAYGGRRPPMAVSFTRDTGRTEWTDQRVLQARARNEQK